MKRSTVIAGNKRGSATLELWHKWSALIFVRAALRHHPGHCEILPESVRRIFKPAASSKKEALVTAAPADLDSEIVRVRDAIEEAGPCAIDVLAERHHLTVEERDVVAFLFSNSASPFLISLRARMEVEGADRRGVTVGFILDALFPESHKVDLRRIFHPARALVSSQLVRVEFSTWSMEEPDLLSMGAELSGRIVNEILGDNTSYVLLSTFLEADVPSVRMDELILEAGFKERVESVIGAWVKSRKREPLSFLFYGPPGTGKTLLAKALAARFKIPLVRMRGLNGGKSRDRFGDGYWDTEDAVRFVLREAASLGGIAFFDECDDIFSKDSPESRSLLLELERHAGLAILATNTPKRLDPALDRRLSLRIPFSIPSREERRRLWKVHLLRAERKVGLVNFDELADLFVFAGGYIRNAVEVAALRVDDKGSIAQKELLAAAEEQAVHFGEDFASRIVTGEEWSPCSESTRRDLEGVSRVALDAASRGESLRVCLHGSSLGDVRAAAAGIAWTLKMGTLVCSPQSLKEESDKDPSSEERDLIGETEVEKLIALLPPDCALAIEDPHGRGGIDGVWQLSRRRPGLYFHLVGAGRRTAPDGPYHFRIEIKPPEPDRRAGLWREALAREGIACDDTLALVLSERHALGASEIAEAARMACWRALSANRPVSVEDVLAAAAAHSRSTAGAPILFGL